MSNSALKKLGEFVPKSVTSGQAKDTGMAMVLIGLLVAVLGRQPRFVGIAMGLLVLDMIWPQAYKPLARIWFGFSHALGSIMSRLIFSLVFVIMVIPVGVVRRLLGKDPLQMKAWKRGRTSVLKVRDHEFAPDDIAHPY
jgi:hypothetical protein